MGEPVERDAVPAEFEFSSSFVDLYYECFTPMVRLAWALTGSEAMAEDLAPAAERVACLRAYLRACRTQRVPGNTGQAEIELVLPGRQPLPRDGLQQLQLDLIMRGPEVLDVA